MPDIIDCMGRNRAVRHLMVEGNNVTVCGSVRSPYPISKYSEEYQKRYMEKRLCRNCKVQFKKFGTYAPPKIEISQDMAFRLLDYLRLNYIYVLKDSHPEELGEDFKPHKWDGFEVEEAQKGIDLHKELLNLMQDQFGHERT